MAVTVVAIGPGSFARQSDEDPSLRSFYSANGLLSRGLNEQAVAEYRAFLEAHENHAKAPTARYGLAVALYRLERPAEALTTLRELEPDDAFAFAPEALLLEARCRLATDDPEGAVAAVERLLDRHAEDELADDGAILAGETMYRASRHDRVVALADRFARQWPDSPFRERIEFLRGLSLTATADFAGAAACFESLRRSHPDGRFSIRTDLLEAQCLHKLDRLSDAAAAYERAGRHDDPSTHADALLGLATVRERLGQSGPAAQALDQYLDRHGDHPKSGSARLLRGRLWLADGKVRQARDVIASVDESMPSAETAYWLAKCELRMDEPEAAARRLERACRRFSDSDLLPMLLYDQAVAWSRAGADEAAMKVLRRFETQFPANELAAQALHLMAASSHRLGEYGQSEKSCRRFLEAYGDHPLGAAVSFLLAENLYLAGQYEPAAVRYREHLERFGSSEQAVKARFRLGMSLYRTSDAAGARSRLEPVLAAHPQAEEYRTAWLALGDLAFQRGEWMDAERRLSSYLAGGVDAPGAGDALLKLAITQLRQDRPQDALASLDRLDAIEVEEPLRLQAVFERGQALLALGRDADAAGVLDDVVESGDERFLSHAHSHLAGIAWRQGAFADAAVSYEESAEAAADSKSAGEARYQAGLAWMSAGEFTSAARAFEQVLRDHDGHVRRGEAEAQLGLALARLDRPEDALRRIERALAAPADAMDRSLRTSLNYERAWCLRELGRVDEAGDAYRALLDDSSEDELAAHSLLELAELETAADRSEHAAELLRRIRQRARQDASAVPEDVLRHATYRLAHLEFGAERFEEAADLFGAYLNGDVVEPDLAASARLFCGEACFKLGRYGRAREHLEKAAADGMKPEVRVPALLRLGECATAMQQWARSEDAFARFLDAYGDNDLWYQARFGLAWSLENQRRFDDAIAAYRDVTERHQGPTAARAQFQIGECLFATDRHADAVRELVKVDILYAYPEWSAAALYEAGRCLEALKDPAQARKHYQDVTTRFGNTKWAALAAERLEALSRTGLPGRDEKARQARARSEGGNP